MIMTLTLNPAVDKKLYVGTAALGETNKCRLIRTDLSGKGINVANAVRALGRDATALGFMGARMYTEYAAFLDKRGVFYDFVKINGDVRVNIKLTEQSGRETEINENGFSVTDEDIAALFKMLEGYFKKYAGGILCISGSLPAAADPGIYGDIIILAEKHGVRVILDTSGAALKHGVSAVPHCVKPNIAELSEYCGRGLTAPEDIKKEALGIIAEGTELVAVTAGKRGAFFVTKNEFLHAYIKEDTYITVQGTIGAGDALSAALAVCVADGMTLTETARLCIASATASCMREGTVPGGSDDIERIKGNVEVISKSAGG